MLRSALLRALSEDEFDVVGAGPGALDVMTDEWTLHIEGDPPVTALLAIDDEPEDAADLREGRRAVMSPAVERALSAADRELDGALGAALRASGDPLSLDLARAITG